MLLLSSLGDLCVKGAYLDYWPHANASSDAGKLLKNHTSHHDERYNDFAG
jgi:hypothetical protein